MLLVEPLRVASVQTLEPAGQVRLRALEDDVVVRRHQAERVHRPPVALDAELQKPEERAPVVVVAEDRDSVDPPREDVEEAVGERRA
jgi:hypothetical protein